jgi:hypothetical protein
MRGAELIGWQAGDKPGFRLSLQRQNFLAGQLPGLRYGGNAAFWSGSCRLRLGADQKKGPQPLQLQQHPHHAARAAGVCL